MHILLCNLIQLQITNLNYKIPRAKVKKQSTSSNQKRRGWKIRGIFELILNHERVFWPPPYQPLNAYGVCFTTLNIGKEVAEPPFSWLSLRGGWITLSTFIFLAKPRNEGYQARTEAEFSMGRGQWSINCVDRDWYAKKKKNLTIFFPFLSLEVAMAYVCCPLPPSRFLLYYQV